MNDQQKISTTSFYADKSWWLAIMAVICPLLAKYLGLELTPDLMVAIIVPVVGYIIASKTKQTMVIRSQIDNGHFDPPAAPAAKEPEVKP